MIYYYDYELLHGSANRTSLYLPKWDIIAEHRLFAEVVRACEHAKLQVDRVRKLSRNLYMDKWLRRYAEELCLQLCEPRIVLRKKKYIGYVGAPDLKVVFVVNH